jgi:phosphomevalonate kinase
MMPDKVNFQFESRYVQLGSKKDSKVTIAEFPKMDSKKEFIPNGDDKITFYVREKTKLKDGYLSEIMVSIDAKNKDQVQFLKDRLAETKKNTLGSNVSMESIVISGIVELNKRYKFTQDPHIDTDSISLKVA